MGSLDLDSSFKTDATAVVPVPDKARLSRAIGPKLTKHAATGGRLHWM